MQGEVRFTKQQYEFLVRAFNDTNRADDNIDQVLSYGNTTLVKLRKLLPVVRKKDFFVEMKTFLF